MKIPFFIHPDQVSGSEPFFAVDLYNGLLGLLGSLPIALHHVRAVEDQFTHFVYGHEFRAIHINNGSSYTGERNTKRTGLGSVIGSAVTDGGGFGHAVPLQYLGPRSSLPFADGRLMEGVGAAGDQFERLPVHAICLFILLEVFKEGGYAVKAGCLIAFHGREDIIYIRGGKKDKGGALNQSIEHYHYLPVNVKKRQESDDHFPALLKYRPERNGLCLECHHIVMGQDCGLGKSCSASGIRQSSDIFFRIDRNLWWLGRMFFD